MAVRGLSSACPLPAALRACVEEDMADFSAPMQIGGAAGGSGLFEPEPEPLLRAGSCALARRAHRELYRVAQ